MTKQSNKPNKPKPKRTYGQGGVYLRRGEGRYMATVPLGKGPNGERLRWYDYAATEEEAQALWLEALHKRDRGTLAEPNKQTVAQFLNHWLEMEVRHHLRPKTVESYTDIVTNHLSPSLGHHLLRKLTADHVQAMLNRKAKEGKARGTISLMKAVLHVALHFAEKRGWVERNVAGMASVPKAPHKEAPYLTAQQALAFLDALSGHPFEAYYWLVITTGLRRGEACGLRWRDIDFAARTISVAHKLERANGTLQWVAPKTRHSKTTVVLPDVLIPYLQDQRTRREFMRREAGPRWIETDAVFPRPDGLPYSGPTMLSNLKIIMRQIGVPDGTIHTLRHTYATLLLAEGTDIRTLSEVMRHSSPSTTLSVYAHVLPQLKQAAADSISRVLKKPPKEGVG